MSVLLRQPHGFVGFGLGSEVVPPGRLAVSRLDCLPSHFLEGHTAFDTVTADSVADDQGVAPGFAHLQNLTTESGKTANRVRHAMKSSIAARTISTFSCDIARAVSLTTQSEHQKGFRA